MHPMLEKTGRMARLRWDPPQFIPLPENRAALLAVRRVARRIVERRSAIPLVMLHGPPGTGKSHLCQALLDFVKDHCSTHRLSAGDWPRFDDAVPLEAIQKCGLLVVEDVQHLPRWAATRLSAILDARLALGHASVLNGCDGPGQLTTLPARLANRLAGGLLVKLEKPAQASRRILVAELVRWRHLRMTEAGQNWLATNGPSSTREMIALLDRLAILGASSANELGVDAIRPLLQSDFLDRRPNVDKIALAVAKRFDVELRHLHGPDRNPGTLTPRHVSMYLARTITKLSYAQLGEYFHRDHSTVRHACEKIDEALANDDGLTALIRELRAELA